AAAIPGPSKNPTTITNPDVQTNLSCKKNQEQSLDYDDLDSQDEEKQLDCND
ncbi:11887_t:CDS:1, partial [Cetraspora pellucida]